jgi:putative membrane protein insertion efficiency factor
MIKKFLLSGIKAYQSLSRAVFFNNCRFYPTCSQYAAGAIERYGVIVGVKKSICRILRCSPISDGGYDPVR